MEENFYRIEDLDIWKESRELRKEISETIRNFPESERYMLINQMLRASRSVSANIAEGYGRFHYKESIQFCRQARGSLFELFDHLTVAYDEEYLSDKGFEKYRERIFILVKMINGYIKYLKTKENI